MQPPPGEFQGYKEWYYDDPEEDNREAVGVEGAALVLAAAATTTLPPADIQAAPKVNQGSAPEPNLKQKVRPCTRLATKNQKPVLNEGIITAAEVAKGSVSQPELSAHVKKAVAAAAIGWSKAEERVEGLVLL
ncbi:hypothetical protein RIF29_03408 [Crotalaria pallida]|uniref:Uncharacterized protein n=1 Tax=Crotalaria pallida TaxID=3830 RepID=A0AAN9P9F2_CROPI